MSNLVSFGDNITLSKISEKSSSFGAVVFTSGSIIINSTRIKPTINIERPFSSRMLPPLEELISFLIYIMNLVYFPFLFINN